MKIVLRQNMAATARATNRAIYNRLAIAARDTADDFGRRGRQAIRDQMKATGLGRLANSVRYTSDKRRARASRDSRSPATAFAQRGFRSWTVIWNEGGSDRSTGAFEAYSQGAVIKPTGGRRWVAFPTDAIPKRVGRYKMTPALYNSSGLVNSIGPLVFIKSISANVAFLAVRNVSVTRVTGTRAKALGKRGGVGSGRRKRDLVIAFVLIRATTRNRRFDPASILGREVTRLPNLYLQAVTGNPAPLFSMRGTATAMFIPTTRVAL